MAAIVEAHPTTLLELYMDVAHENADARSILVWRFAEGEYVCSKVDVMAILRTGDNSSNIQLAPEDVVYVPGKNVDVRAIGRMQVFRDASAIDACSSARAAILQVCERLLRGEPESPEALDATMILALRAPIPNRRAQAIMSLSAESRRTSDIAKVLVECLGDRSVVVASSAAAALGAMDCPTETVMAALCQAAKSKDKLLRETAQASLDKLGGKKQ